MTALLERAGECRLLSRLLAAPPDAGLLDDARAVGLLAEGEGFDPESVAVEYTRLLSAPGPDAVLAHQSAYTDTLSMEPSAPDAFGCGLAFAGGMFQGYVGGESCSEVRRWYAAAGFVPADPAPGMADHAAAELEFLAYLRAGEAGAGSEAEAASFRDLRGRFWERFLGRWLAPFGERLSRNSASELYRRVGIRLIELSRELGDV